MTTLPAHDAHSHDSHGHDGHGHDHPAHLAHHWESSQQQFDAGKLGMWLFLATEVLLFGGLFCAYAVWRGNHPELFKFGSQYLDTFWGAVNTAVLILSSLTMAWGVTCAQLGQRKGLILCLVLTLMGAMGFLGIKYIEYSHKFHMGLFPTAAFYHGTPPGHDHADDHVHADAGAPHAAPAPGGAAHVADAPKPLILPGVESSTVLPAATGPTGMAANAELVEVPFKFEDRHAVHATVHPVENPERPAYAGKFFTIYFLMTGLHGIHVVIGMIVIVWLLVRTIRGDFSAEYFTPVDLGGLYWHIVDLIWIFLFPLFYLI